MYEKFFQFRDRPFQLVPNPAYLFLSRGHEETLAHLSYAIMHGDGFVVITGEVGTGKTTLCRYFLDDLGEDTEAAYIFNPKLNCIQLLKTINDEFEINSEADTVKELIDVLNAYLIAKKSEGKKVVLLIDEAQNLSKDVLEQVRLLSNLETNTSKLLQIILVGQPELGDMLHSHSLRQLGQRVTLHYHLPPLSRKESAEYIQHRIHVASNKGTVKFSRAALMAIYTYSKGTPRLINIACDRALLTAYSNNQHTVSWTIARQAIRELDTPTAAKTGTGNVGGKGTIIVGVVVLVTLFFVFLFSSIIPLPLTSTIHAPREDAGPANILPSPQVVAQQPRNLESQQPTALPAVFPETQRSAVEPSEKQELNASFADILKSIDVKETRYLAIQSVLQRWNPQAVKGEDLTSEKNTEAFFKTATERQGMKLLRVENDFSIIQRLNLPAVLEFFHPETAVIRYLAVISEEGSVFTLEAGEGIKVKATPQEIVRFWSGVAYIPWRDFLSITGTIPGEAPAHSILLLKMLLHDIGFSNVALTGVYDTPAIDAVKAVQASNGLEKDGVVGPRTKIVLYNSTKSVETPKMRMENLRRGGD